ncbi:MAG TPA: histidine kinase, partial [Sphingomicrobium sp.]|nr:histidine kinase [Sphingomicrobium sp.]
RWSLAHGVLRFHWEESGGPRVTPPTKKGFGSRLLERLLVRDLSGNIELNYDPDGLQFSIAAAL